MAKKKGAFFGGAILATTPMWQLIGKASDIDFLVHLGKSLDPRVINFLSHWGWLISLPLGLVILFLALRREPGPGPEVASPKAGAITAQFVVDLAKSAGADAKRYEEEARAERAQR